MRLVCFDNIFHITRGLPDTRSESVSPIIIKSNSSSNLYAISMFCFNSGTYSARESIAFVASLKQLNTCLEIANSSFSLEALESKYVKKSANAFTSKTSAMSSRSTDFSRSNPNTGSNSSSLTTLGPQFSQSILSTELLCVDEGTNSLLLSTAISSHP